LKLISKSGGKWKQVEKRKMRIKEEKRIFIENMRLKEEIEVS
jgi:hypothetical protein